MFARMNPTAALVQFLMPPALLMYPPSDLDTDEDEDSEEEDDGDD